MENNHTLSGFSMTQPQIRQRDNDEAMVGQQIPCMIEATFEDGFFISVKVDNSDSVLRGVVFKPGRCVPVSVDNDVAPHLPVIRRNLVHPHASSNRGRKYTVCERRDSGDKSLVPVPIQHAQPAHPTIPMHRVVPVVRSNSKVLVPAQPAQLDSDDRSLVNVPIQYAQNDHHGSANTGRKYTLAERRDSGDRSLVTIPIQHDPDQHALAPVSAPPAQRALAPVYAPPAQRALVHVPAPPTCATTG